MFLGREIFLIFAISIEVMILAKNYIYADNAATTRLAPEALEAMMPYLTDEYGNPSSLYSFSRSAKKALADARAVIAECIGASPEEIFFTSGGTESDNWAINNFVFAEFHRKRNILISPVEHHAIFNTCQKIALVHRYTITSTPVNDKGKIILPIYKEHVEDYPDGISIMLANNEIGTIEDISQMTDIAHHYCIPFHTDAVQAMGHIPIDVKKLGVDMLSASAHKFNGPKGIGFLYVKQNTVLKPFIDGGQQEAGRRAGTENVAAIVGMATALRLCCERMNEVTARLAEMTACFRKIINANLPEAAFNGDPEHRLPGHISLSIPGISGEGLLHVLDLQGIAISTGAACNSKSTEISHVLKAIELPEKLSKGTVRITFGVYNTVVQAQYIADKIVEYCKANQDETD